MDVLSKIKDAGIVGAGGAGFPTHIKLSAKVESVIANGAECEPLLQGDQILMALFPDKILNGLKIVMRLTRAREGIIALKKKYTSAINVLKDKLHDEPNIKLFLLDDVYPVGDEQILVYEVLKKIVPQGGIPLDVGVVVCNVGTLANISDAMHDKAVTERILTVAGAVRNPKVLKVPIGTSFKKIIEFAGGVTTDSFQVVSGGPMMGNVVKNLSSPITKLTNGVIVLPDNNPLILRKTTPPKMKIIRSVCLNCGLCTQICPRNLIGHDVAPDKIMRALILESRSEYLTSARWCSECGVCTHYSCIMDLDPCGVIKLVKSRLPKETVVKKGKFRVNEFREIRRVPTIRLIARLNLAKYCTKFDKIEKRDVAFVKIPLRQHIGEPSVPVVKIGEFVKKNDIIATTGGKMGANIHASISGYVEHISDFISIRRS